jgi:transcriptional regulator GlxA family with amidase domain
MRIGVLVYPGVQMLEVSGPLDVFSEAAQLSGRPDAYQFELIAVDEGMIRASNGMLLQPTCTIDSLPRDIDTLLVAGGPSILAQEKNAHLMHWLVRQADMVRRLGSICSGALLLAAAGLLEQRSVTTHWSISSQLARRFPSTKVEQDRIYIRDGSIYTSAGVSAGMDLALALVEEDMGSEIALQVARRLLMYLKRPGGQSQFAEQPSASVAERSAIRAVQEWVSENLGKDLSVERLAERAAMSVRNFSRLFKADTGMTPATFVEDARLAAARRILEASPAPMKRVADWAGFPDPSSLRRAFVRRLGVTPSDYRKQFAANP